MKREKRERERKGGRERGRRRAKKGGGREEGREEGGEEEEGEEEGGEEEGGEEEGGEEEGGERKGGMKGEGKKRKGRGGGKRQSRRDIYTCRYSSSYMHTYVSSSLIPKLCSPSKWPGNEVSFSDNIPLNPIQQSLEHTHTHTESPSSIPSLTPLRTQISSPLLQIVHTKLGNNFHF